MMEIRDPVHGSIRLTQSEADIIESRQFQRLRAIKQLGFAEFSFPGATHNRFLHSIGVCHLAGLAFDGAFKLKLDNHPAKKSLFKSLVRGAALLHDIGHGPLSHTTEDVMPLLSDLNIDIYKNRKKVSKQLEIGNDGNDGNNDETLSDINLNNTNLGNTTSSGKTNHANRANRANRASHEDYTIKFIVDSPLTQILEKGYPDCTPYHFALLIDRSLIEQDHLFVVDGIDYRPALSQIVSSELDADRMDYLERDSYFCGTNYGKVDSHWLVSHMTLHIENNKAYLAINRRALYTFDDFLLSRHHMHLMVYFHHKSIIYEELLNRFLTSDDCGFKLPSDIDEYTLYNDYKLFEFIAASKNPWAQRIAQKKLYKVLLELHSTESSGKPQMVRDSLIQEGIDVIWASSQARLSKYHSSLSDEKAVPIFVVDPYNKWDKPNPIDQSTEIFAKYEDARIIDRLYVKPEDLETAKKILSSKRLY